jgi:hypothetical protein
VTFVSDEWREEATGLTVIRLERQWRLLFDPFASVPNSVPHIGLDKYVGWNVEGGCGKVILLSD